MNEDTPIFDTDIKGWNFFDKWGRRSACVRSVLIAVPWTGDAAIEDFAFTKGSVLMLADVGYGGDLAVVFEDGDAFPTQANDARAVFRNFGDGTDVDEVGGGVERFGGVLRVACSASRVP